MPSRRTILRVAAGFGLLSLGALGLHWWQMPEPPRAVFRPPGLLNSTGQGFAEGGRTFLTFGAEGTVVWDAATWRPRSTWPLLACQVLATSRDGRLGVGIHGYDESSARIVVVDLATGEVRHRFEADLPRVALATWDDCGCDYYAFTSGVRLTDFAEPGPTVRAFLADRQGFVREVASWNLATGVAHRVPIGGPGPGVTGPQPLALAPNGTTCAVIDFPTNRLGLWDLRANQPIGSPIPPTSATPSPGFQAAAFTPDGRTLIGGRTDGRLEVRDLAGRRSPRTILAHPGGVGGNTIVVGRDGRTVLSMGWRAGAGSAITEWVDDLKHMIGMTTGGQPEVVALDLATGQILARWPGAHNPHLAPDGRTAVMGEPDGSFAVRDIPPLPALAAGAP